MNDLISRQAALDALEREKTYCTAFRDGYTPINVFEKYNAGLTDGIKALKKLPSVEVEPVKTGRWEPHPSEREWDVCSICHIGTKRREYGLNDDGIEWVTERSYTYCPWCGARMSEGSEKC